METADHEPWSKSKPRKGWRSRFWHLPSRPAADDQARDHEHLTIIEPRSGWRMVDLGELWRARELLYLLIRRDIKVRYSQTLLGIGWAVMQPLGLMLVFSTFLGRVAAAPAADVPYPLFLFSGLLPWTFFANAVSAASQSVLANQGLITKIYFPRLLVPSGAVAAGLLDFTLGFGVLLGLLAWFGVPLGPGLLWAPVLGLLLLAATLGAGILLSALTVVYRDFRYVVPFLLQLGMFATPCVYLQAGGDAGWKGRMLLSLNPVYGLVTNFRAAVLGREFDLISLAVSSCVGLGLLVGGCLYFRRVERRFADII